jgi:hypothetical protein
VDARRLDIACVADARTFAVVGGDELRVAAAPRPGAGVAQQPPQRPLVGVQLQKQAQVEPLADRPERAAPSTLRR